MFLIIQVSHPYWKIVITTRVKLGGLFMTGTFYFLTENKAVGVMKPGHTFTIEPMISQGNQSTGRFVPKSIRTQAN